MLSGCHHEKIQAAAVHSGAATWTDTRIRTLSSWREEEATEWDEMIVSRWICHGSLKDDRWIKIIEVFELSGYQDRVGVRFEVALTTRIYLERA